MILYHGSYTEVAKPNLQIAFRTQKVIDACLVFERGEQL